MSRTFNDLRATGVLDALAECYTKESEARALLLAAGVDARQIAPMLDAPDTYWINTMEEMVRMGWSEAIIERAAAKYPQNTILTGRPLPIPPHTTRPASALESDGARLDEGDRSPSVWFRAQLLDRMLQWMAMQQAARTPRSMLIMLHGHRDQALFQFIQRCREGDLAARIRVVEIPFRRDGQDPGPLDARVWLRDIRHRVATSLGVDDIAAARRQHRLIIAIEAPHPQAPYEGDRVRALVNHLPNLLAEPGRHPLVTVVVCERSGPPDGFLDELIATLRCALQARGLGFLDLPVTFPDWQQVSQFLDGHDFPAELRRPLRDTYEQIERAGGSFKALADLIEDALDQHYASYS